jgi:hypothetical protein
MKMYPSDFAVAPVPIRLTLLAALCWDRKAEMIDGLVELLIQLVHEISVRAERKVENEINSEFRRVHGKNGILVKLATAALCRRRSCARPCIRWSGNGRWRMWSSRPRPTRRPSTSGCGPNCAAPIPTTTGGDCPSC